MEEESFKNIKIVIGTYEEYVLGYQLIKDEEGYSLKQCFANHAHIGSVRCLSSSSKYVASGGVDESVKLMNMKTGNEFGTLLQHNGTITDVEFIGDSHLVSSSEDGNICIFTTNNWQCQKTLRGHKKAVNCVSVHPSHKLLLSASKDKTLRSWNLVKGRSAYVTNLKHVSELVKWSPEGSTFVCANNNDLDVYSTSGAGVVHKIEFGSRIATVDFLSENIIAIGGESEEIQIHCLESKECLNKFKAHEKRVKTLQSFQFKDKVRWLVSVSNDGFIKIFQIKMKPKMLKKEPKLITQVNTQCRPTCLSVYGVEKIVPEKTSILEEDSKVDEEPASKKRKKSSGLNGN